MMPRSYFGPLFNDPTAVRAEFDKLWTEPPPFVAMDTETISLKDRSVLGVGFATPTGHAFYLDLWEQGVPWHLFTPVGKNRKIWHNASFDLAWEVLGQYGADIDNIDDTSIITRLLQQETELSLACYGREHETWSVASYLAHYKAKQMTDLPWEVIADKCMRDCLVTMDIWLDDYKNVDKTKYEVKRKLMCYLLHQSHRGIKLDKPRLQAIDAELENDIDLYYGQAQAIGFNPNSGEQVAYMLSTQGVMVPVKRGAKRVSVDRDWLSQIDHPWAALTIQARKVGKLHTRTHKWLALDRVSSHFKTESATWRVRSSDDNLQNLDTGRNPGDIVPKAGQLRSVLLPDEDDTNWAMPIEGHELGVPVFTKWDLSQIELRCFAYFADDKEMQFLLDYKRDHPDDINFADFHTETMHALRLANRLLTKRMIFGGMLYGGKAPAISKATGIRDLAFIEQKQLEFDHRWPVSAAYKQRQGELGLRELNVETMYGQKLSLINPNSQKDMTDAHIRNMAVAYPSQGSAVEVFERQLDYLVEGGYIPIDKLSLMVHDEQWVNGRYKLPEQELANISPIWTPIEVEYLERGR